MDLSKHAGIFACVFKDLKAVYIRGALAIYFKIKKIFNRFLLGFDFHIFFRNKYKDPRPTGPLDDINLDFLGIYLTECIFEEFFYQESIDFKEFESRLLKISL